MKKYHELLEEHYNKTTLTSDEEFELCKAFCRYHGFTDSEIEFYIPSNEILNWNSSLEQELENNNVVINDVKDIIIDNFINKFIDDVEEDFSGPPIAGNVVLAEFGHLRFA